MKLLDMHPLPWRTIGFTTHGGWAILDGNSVEVMFCADFTGDGATISLEQEQAEELCALLNRNAA